jgi:hypothetical protein
MERMDMDLPARETVIGFPTPSRKGGNSGILGANSSPASGGSVSRDRGFLKTSIARAFAAETVHFTGGSQEGWRVELGSLSLFMLSQVPKRQYDYYDTLTMSYDVESQVNFLSLYQDSFDVEQ